MRKTRLFKPVTRPACGAIGVTESSSLVKREMTLAYLLENNKIMEFFENPIADCGIVIKLDFEF